MKTRTCLLESLFLSKAIKTEYPATVQWAAFQLEIFSGQDAPLSVPATSFLLVAVASRVCQFECFLRRMANGETKGR